VRDEDGNITRVIDVPAVPITRHGRIVGYMPLAEAEALAAESKDAVPLLGAPDSNA
jgi:hypothetical protein